MTYVINLTQHKATPDQQAAGVVDLPEDQRKVLTDLLTFDTLPDNDTIIKRANSIAMMVNADSQTNQGLIGGAMWLMAPLTKALKAAGFTALFAFSTRDTVEQTQPDGSIKKTTVFRHTGFVEAV